MCEWMREPMVAPNTVPPEMKYALFIDESGTAGYKDNKPYFTLAGCIMNRGAMLEAQCKLTNLKKKYWPNGQFAYKHEEEKARVVFHLRDIMQAAKLFREDKPLSRDNPFCQLGRHAFNSFLEEFMQTIQGLDFTVFSVTINKDKMRAKYCENAYEPYSTAAKYMLERVRKYLAGYNDDRTPNVVLILEKRGKREDSLTHKSLMGVLRNGTEYLDSDNFAWVAGAYFCGKHDENGKSYYGLELADFCAYPIKQHFFAPENPSEFFNIVHEKVFYYNTDKEQSYGLKLFP